MTTLPHIGLSGWPGAGKDTVAHILCQSYGYRRVAFADRLRHFAYKINPPIRGKTLAELVDREGWDTAKQRPEVRLILQQYGQSAREVLGADVWMRPVLAELDNTGAVGAATIAYSDKPVVVPDCRHLNEVRAIRERGGVIWRVQRAGIPEPEHPVEHVLDNAFFEATLYNGLDNLVSLEKNVAALMGALRAGKDTSVWWVA